MAQLKDLIVTGDTTIVGNESIGGITTSAGGFVGNLTGTASKAIGDKNGADITTTYYKANNPNGYTSNTGTITGVSVNSTSVATSGVANITSIPASILTGAIPSAVTATTQSQGNNSTKIATTAYVDTAITNLPEPMIFKGSLGTGGTITSLPTAAASNEGHTYKVITAGTYASQAAKVGDTFISDGSAWVLIPSGDEPSGTVTSITIKGSSPITVDSESAITTSGTRTISHANSGVTAGTYKSVTVNATGHVTGGSNPTTLSGYGITDAKIASGVITLGSNTITPVPVGSIDITDQTTTLLALTKALGTAGTNYARWYSRTDGGTANISDKPTGTSNAGFVCEAYCNRNNGTSDYRYVLICWVQEDKNPYVATVSTSTTTISWSRLNIDTKNTAGSTDSSSKLFLIGATSQAANPQTYSQDTAYVDTNGHLYSNSKQVVNLSDSQALTNKTYNGYTLAAASAKAVDTSISAASTSANLPTSAAVATFVEGKGYVLKSGDTMTGALNFANNTVNKVGDDVSFGDFNKAGTLGIIGQNGSTGIALIKNGSSWSTSSERAEMVYNSTNKCIEFNFV